MFKGWAEEEPTKRKQLTTTVREQSECKLSRKPRGK